MLRRVLVCAAFATWCFLNTWVEFAEGRSAYFSRYAPLRAVVIPVLLWELLITAGMLCAWEVCRRWRLANALSIQFLFLASCLVPFGIAAVATLRVFPFDLAPLIRNPWFWPAALVAAVVPLVWALLRPRAASRLLRGIFLYSWPVLAVVLLQAWGNLLKFPAARYADHALAAPLPPQPARVRVVWIIFDELSQEIAFDRRPEGLHLPEFDRLRAESFYASSAHAPAGSTELSMPSLILGQKVVAIFDRGPDRLELQMAARPGFSEWSGTPNVFDTARSLGFNTALVGWFHPYGRLLSHSLSKCFWTAGWLTSGIEEPTAPQALTDAMWSRARLQFAALPLVGHFPGFFPGIYQRRAKIERFSYLLDRSREVVSDPSIGLALIHLPVPHPPAIYSRSERRITAEGRIGYVDSVALADDTLGILRRSMERAGLWERTAVLISADHGWRTYLWRGDPEWTPDEEAACHGDVSGVPFILKLPGQKSGIAYSKPFDTIVTRQTITDTLNGRLTDPNMLPGYIGRLAECDHR